MGDGWEIGPSCRIARQRVDRRPNVWKPRDQLSLFVRPQGRQRPCPSFLQTAEDLVLVENSVTGFDLVICGDP